MPAAARSSSFTGQRSFLSCSWSVSSLSSPFSRGARVRVVYRERPADEHGRRAEISSRVERDGKLALADASGPQRGGGTGVGEQRLGETAAVLCRARSGG